MGVISLDVCEALLDEGHELVGVGQDPESFILHCFEHHVADLVRVHAAGEFVAQTLEELIFELVVVAGFDVVGS